MKKLHLSAVNKSVTFSLLEKIKQNKSLTEFCIARNFYDDTDINAIKRIMNCSNIRHLYISKNKINNLNNCIRIIYRTKLIQEDIIKKDVHSMKEQMEIISERNKKDIILGNKPLLINLDISNNEAWILNEKHAHLIHKIINETTLSCLDLSHILFGPFPEKNPYLANPSKYKSYINDKIKDNLMEKKKYYKRIYSEKKNNKVDIKRLGEEISKSKYKDIIKDIEEKFGNDINKIIDNNDAIHPIYLKSKSEEIIEKIKNKQENLSKINNKFNLKGEEDVEKFKTFLATYMRKRKAEYDLIKNKNELEKKKLIII